MTRKLIATALATAFIAPAALAQSEPPVTMYGRMWLMFNAVQAPGGATPVASRNTVTDGSSLLGFRATENLGGSLRAFFQIESAVVPDAGTGTLASRNSAVGLRGNFGSVMLGRWDSPFKLSAIIVDPTSQITLANQLSVINTGDFNRRENNTVQYLTPDLGAFKGRFMYSANEGRTATANPSLISASVEYANGPFRINYANERHKDQRGGTVTAGVTEVGQNLSGTAVFGPVKVGLLAQHFKSTDRTNRKAYQASVTYTMGKQRMFLTLGQNKDGAVSTAAQPESKLVALGYDYEFSKRTMLAVRYASLKNNAASSANLNNSGLPTLTANADPRGFGIGLRHTF
jgi:predicted porin